MSSDEIEFRAFERILDAAVRQCEARLKAFDIHPKDSSRRRHERGEYLCWSYEFSRSWDLELETAQVRIILSFFQRMAELNSPTVCMWRCAERFRPGQISRIREVAESDIPMPIITSLGLGDFVIQEMKNGAHLLGQGIELLNPGT